MGSTSQILIGAGGLLLLMGGLVGLLVRVMRRRLAVWRQLAEPLGGDVRFVLGLNATMAMLIPTESGSIRVEQWQASSGGEGNKYGQLVVRLCNRGFAFSPFYVGDDAWAAAFARWAPKVPRFQGFASGAPSPLAQGRCADPEAFNQIFSTEIQARLIALRVYLVFGRGDTIRFHVPGGVLEESQLPLLRETVELAQSIEMRAVGGRSRRG